MNKRTMYRLESLKTQYAKRYARAGVVRYQTPSQSGRSASFWLNKELSALHHQIDALTVV